MANAATHWPDPEIPDNDPEGMRVPPWVKYPNLPKASIGWQMGMGEEYWDNFRDWWSRQLRETQLLLRTDILNRWIGKVST